MLAMGAIGEDQTMQTRIQAPWSRIEPGQGGGRLMGLDGHQAPPIPGRPIVRKPRPSPAAGFSFWCEAATVPKWSVQKESNPVFTVER
jgi:hypothetical protein